MNIVLEAGADDIQNDGGQWVVLSAPENHVAVLEAIQKAGSRRSKRAWRWCRRT